MDYCLKTRGSSLNTQDCKRVETHVRLDLPDIETLSPASYIAVEAIQMDPGTDGGDNMEDELPSY